jgi:hypothetical protein
MYSKFLVVVLLVAILNGCVTAPVIRGEVISKQQATILIAGVEKTLGLCPPIKLITQCSNEHIAQYGDSCVYAFMHGSNPVKPNAHFLITAVEDDSFAGVYQRIKVEKRDGKTKQLSIISGCRY